jgi:nitrite reductase/ring-hydroxylating ferredoxin subunit
VSGQKSREQLESSEVRAAGIDAVPEGKGVVVEVGGKVLALFRYAGEFYALDESCPHRGGPLHEGMIQEGVLACPWHLWQFDLKTGVSPVNPLSKVRTYRVRVDGTDLFVELGGP